MAHGPFGAGKNGGKRPSERRPRQDKPARKCAAYEGLCATCAKRTACEVPAREGGVWHCEEYEEEH